MSDVATAVLALAGAGLGAIVTHLSARMSQRSSERIAQQRIVEERLQVTRQTAADAYANALDAVAWLHTNRVEDSVLEPLATTIEGEYRDSIRRLRDARFSLNKVSALTANTPLSSAAAEVARELGILDDAWEDARVWRQWMSRKDDKRSESLFDKAMSRLVAAREALTGTDAWGGISEEIAAGGVEIGSLLGRLRSAIGETAAGAAIVSQARRSNAKGSRNPIGRTPSI